MRHVDLGKLKSYFDDLIDRHAEAYLEAYAPEVQEFNSFSKSGTEGYYIGMIWTNEFQKPDIHELKLMGSKSLTDNKIVELDIKQVTDTMQSFFPGQIVAFKAEPFVRRQLVAREFLDPIKIAPKMKSINTDDTIRLAIACGPFMKPDSVEWTLIEQITSAIKENHITHAILIGPFVDIENKQARGQYEACWKGLFDRLIEGLCDHPCNIYLVPSTRDVMGRHLGSNYFYPTPSIQFTCNLKKGVEVKCKILTVSDPEQIDLGGVYLDVTSAEVEFHLNSCTAFIQPPSNRFTLFYKHILTHGIYPIYPPPTDFAVDYTKFIKCIGLDRLSPHILVLPSRFRQTVGNFEDRLIVTVPKCSTKRQMVYIELPKIESNSETPTNSVVQTEFIHKDIQLECN